MFTGIIEAAGEIAAVDTTADGRRLWITAPFTEELTQGQSVSVDGACLTVEDTAADRGFEVFLSAETIERTTVGERSVGDRVNLERAMPADGRFDGHLVQGHVDARTEVRSIQSIGEDWMYVFALDTRWDQYVVEKGSVSLDGVSLTVASRDDDTFSVAIVPATYEKTTFSALEPGDMVNVEVDVLAKYVEQLC